MQVAHSDIYHARPARYALLRQLTWGFAAVGLSLAVAHAAPAPKQAGPGTPAQAAEQKVDAPLIALAGKDKFDITSQHLARGVYQSAYSEKNNRLFITTAVGRPPIKESQLLKVNPDTLAIEARGTAAPSGKDDGNLIGVYGIASDDAHGHIWVTNTRNNTVAVYSQSDLSLVKQFDAGVVEHARDVIIDPSRNKAYASSANGAAILTFDTKTLTAGPAIALSSDSDVAAKPMSLDLDSRTGKLYTVSLSTNEAFVIDLDTEKVEKVIPLPNAKGTIGVAVDTESDRLFVAAQGSHSILIVDLASGKVLHDVPVGAGPLNVVFDPVSDYAYVALRGAGTLVVLDRDGVIVANLEVGTFPNHITLDNKGNVFLLNKAKGQDDPTGDRLTRLTLKK